MTLPTFDSFPIHPNLDRISYKIGLSGVPSPEVYEVRLEGVPEVPEGARNATHYISAVEMLDIPEQIDVVDQVIFLAKKHTASIVLRVY